MTCSPPGTYGLVLAIVYSLGFQNLDGILFLDILVTFDWMMDFINKNRWYFILPEKVQFFPCQLQSIEADHLNSVMKWTG